MQVLDVPLVKRTIAEDSLCLLMAAPERQGSTHASLSTRWEHTAPWVKQYLFLLKAKGSMEHDFRGLSRVPASCTQIKVTIRQIKCGSAGTA